jgi:23S rRNA pseudouridine1911/1915/1917 synthase
VTSGEDGIFFLQVPPEAKGQRLDRFLRENLPDRSRSLLSRWIQDNRVSIDGRVAGKPGVALKSGSQIAVEPPPPPADTPQPEDIEIPILYQDDDIVVVDKPINLVVHPGNGQPDGTLVNGLLGLGIELAATGGARRPGVVHRLDRDTSGVLVVAKTDAAHAGLSRAFAERRIHKTYHALVWGRPDPDSATIDRGIGRSRNNPTKMAVQGTRGARRIARTHYKTVESLPGFAHLEIDLETGRTHQIRVHLQSIHHPVVGDERYGGRSWRGIMDPLKRRAVKTFQGLALHAAELRFEHPIDGRSCTYRAELPERMTRLFDALRDQPQ